MAAKLPKKKCCTSRPKCKRCPLQMMSNGTLPSGFTVKKRKLVKIKKDKKAATRSGAGSMPKAA